MKISVITPSFNSADYIERAIRSVQAQEYADVEHIIIDNASTDGTLEIIEKYPQVRCVSEKDSGQSNAMNKGFALSTGEIIVYLNCDDYFLPGAFGSVIPWFEQGETFVVGDLQIIDLKGETRHAVPGVEHATMLRHWMPNAFPNNPVQYFYRREVQEQIPFNEANHLTMDVEFLLEASRRFPVKKIDRELGVYLLRPDAKSVLAAQDMRNYWTFENFAFVDTHLGEMATDTLLDFKRAQQRGYLDRVLQLFAAKESRIIAERQSIIDERNLQLEEKQTQIDDRKAEIAALKRELEARDATLAERNAQLTEKQMQVNERIAQLARKDEQIAERQHVIDERNAQLTEKQQIIEDRKAQIARLEQTLEATSAQVAERQRVIDERNAQLNAKQRIIEDRKAEISQMQRTLEQKERNIAQRQRIIDERNAQLTEKQQIIEDRKAQIARLEQTLEATSAQVAERQCIIDERNAQLTEKQQIIEERKAQIATLQRQVRLRRHAFLRMNATPLHMPRTKWHRYRTFVLAMEGDA